MSLSKAVFGGAALLTLSSALTRLLSVVTAPLLTRLLGPAPYGVIALVGTSVALLSTLAVMGIEIGYARHFFTGDPSYVRQVERFVWRFAATTTSIVCAAVALFWALGLAPRFSIPSEVPPMVLIGVVASISSVLATARMRLHGRYVHIGMSAIVNGVVAAGSSIAFALWWRQDAWVFVISGALGTAASLVVLGGLPVSTLPHRSVLTSDERWRIFQMGVPVAITAPMYWVLSSSDRWFIGLLRGPEELGIYAFAYNVGNFAVLLNNAVVQTWLPETLRAFDEDPINAPTMIGAVWARMYTLMGISWVAVAGSGGDVIRWLAAPEFHAGVVYVPWIAGAIFLYGLYHTCNTGLVLRNDLRPAAVWWILGAVASVGLNLVLVRAFGAMGAAVTACISFALISAGVLWSSQRALPVPLPWSRVSLVSLILFTTGVAMAPAWHSSALVSLALKFPVGLAASWLALQIVAPSWISTLLRRLLRRAV